jgi:hypothetical protein
MTPWLLILFFNFDATVIEFPGAAQCYEAQREIAKQVGDNKDVAIGCFKKLGSHKKDS